jgi:hypothetical protein
MFSQALVEQGLDPDDAEFLISTYGTDADAISVTAMRIPGMPEGQLDQMARLMSGLSDGQASAETATVGGKEVLVITATAQGQQGYMYIADGAVFIVGGGSEELAAELLSQLP